MIFSGFSVSWFVLLDAQCTLLDHFNHVLILLYLRGQTFIYEGRPLFTRADLWVAGHVNYGQIYM